MPQVDAAAQAALVAAARKAQRAAELQRSVIRELKQAAAGFDVAGAQRCTRPEHADQVRELVALALSRHGDVQVVVLINPPRPPQRGEEEPE